MQPEQAAPSVEMLRTQVDELSQTKVESSSRMPVRIFGAIVSNTVGNSGMANWLENPNMTDAEVPGMDAGSFTSTLRQSQIGFNVGSDSDGQLDGAARQWSRTSSAACPGSSPAPSSACRAWSTPSPVSSTRAPRCSSARITNLLAPRDPTSLAAQAFPLLFRSGNLYLRSPQVRVEQKVGGLHAQRRPGGADRGRRQQLLHLRSAGGRG